MIPDIEDLPPICLRCDMTAANLLTLDLIDAMETSR